MFGKSRNLKIESNYIRFAFSLSFWAHVTLPGMMLHKLFSGQTKEVLVQF
jgi:hypothetical protein